MRVGQPEISIFCAEYIYQNVAREFPSSDNFPQAELPEMTNSRKMEKMWFPFFMQNIKTNTSFPK